MIGSQSVRRFVMGGAITSLLAVVGVKAFGFLESIVVGRILGSVQFGLMALVFSVANLVSAFSNLGLAPALTKFLSGEASSSREAAEGTLSRAVWIVGITSVIAGISGGFVAVFLLAPYFQDSRLPLLLALGILLAAVSAPFGLFGPALQGLGAVHALNLRAVIAGGIGFAIAIPLALSFGAAGGVAATMLGTILVGALALPAVMRSLRHLPRHSEVGPVPTRSLLNFGLPALTGGFIVLSASYWINSLMATGRGYADLGAFAVAVTLATVVSLIPSSVGMPLVPVLSSLSISEPRRGERVVSRIMRVVVFISVPIALVWVCFAQEIIGLTYGAAFSGGSSFLPVLAISSIFSAISGVVGAQIAGTGRMWWSLGLNLLWAVIVSVAASMLIPQFGGVGASTALLVGYAVLAIAALAVGRAALHVGFSGLTRPGAWAACLLVPALVTVNILPGWRIPVGGLLSVVSIASLAWLLDAGERSLLKELLSLVLGRRRAR